MMYENTTPRILHKSSILPQEGNMLQQWANPHSLILNTDRATKPF